MKPSALAVVVALLLVAPRASAEGLLGGMHAAYAPGLAFGAADEGFRHQLDAGVLFAIDKSRVGNRDGMWSRGSAWLLGPAVLTGFGATPTYPFVELGRGEDTTLLGWAWLVGPAARVGGAEAGAGITGRFAVDLMAVQAGVRVVAIAGPGPAEGQIALTLGLGRF